MSASTFRIAVVVSPPVETNGYVLHLRDSREALVFDPGSAVEDMLGYLDENGLIPAAILATHGHWDHISGIRAFKARWPACPLLIGKGDAPLLTDPELNLSARHGWDITSPPADRTLAHNEVFSAAGIELEVREIPGHSPGHIVYLWKESEPWIVFGGDVLFRGSVGRTDLPGGSFPTLRKGIHDHLFPLPEDTIVLSGHGDATTIGDERARNPFVGLRSALGSTQFSEE